MNRLPYLPSGSGRIAENHEAFGIIGEKYYFITHKLQEVMEVSDRIMVMRAGECIQTIPTSETNIEELSFMMVGRRVLKRTVEY